MKIKLLKLGSDPEVFIKNKITGQHKSIEGLLGGTKDLPFPMDKEGFFFLEDGLAMEFNINPADNPKEFSDNIEYALNYLESIIPEEYEISIIPSADFVEEDLLTPQAQTVGCEPDFNAWTGQVNQKPDISDKMYRSAGSHLHCSYENPDRKTSVNLIRLMELYITLPLSILDTDKRRMSLYGKSGAFRFKDYGFELRSPSNFWITTDELRQWVFTQAELAVNHYNEKGGITSTSPLAIAIQSAINDCNTELAKELCTVNGIILPKIEIEIMKKL